MHNVRFLILSLSFWGTGIKGQSKISAWVLEEFQEYTDSLWHPKQSAGSACRAEGHMPHVWGKGGEQNGEGGSRVVDMETENRV